MTRRQILKLLGSAGAVEVASGTPIWGDSTVRLTPLVKDVAVISGSGGNMLVHRSREGVVLIDSGLATSFGAVRFTLSGYSALPVVYLINTHWHYDHTGGNPAFGESGAHIIAHKNCRSRLMTKQRMEFLNRTVEALPQPGWPVETIETRGSLANGDESITYEFIGAAHTDGDITVHLANANALHCGDLFFNGMYPFVDYSSGGSLEGMVLGAETILKKIDNDAALIPGHGPVATKRDFRAFYEMMASVNEKFKKMIAQAKSLEEIQASGLTAAYDSEWGKGMLSSSEWLRMLYAGETGKNATRVANP